MQMGKIIDDLKILHEDLRSLDSLITYIGTRTREELKTILGLKGKAFAFLVDKCGREKNLNTELEAFLAAAASYRRHQPHNARLLAKIAQEREDKKGRHRQIKTLRGRVEQDFRDITTMLEAGYSWREVANELKTRNTKYRPFKIIPETLRKTYSRVKSDMTPEEYVGMMNYLPDPPSEPPNL